ncbi:hypothetical protein M446_4152 [Methylobacterium sp. 4-46]|nr:hypothetical protein M446_4152 [Methylobacterium sp. 4-46]
MPRFLSNALAAVVLLAMAARMARAPKGAPPGGTIH